MPDQGEPFMADIHDLIMAKGVAAARAEAKTPSDRKAVDVAADVLAEESQRLGITYSGFCLTSLPHKKIREGTWKRDGHRITLIVQSGVDRHERPIGVPYGSKARMILLYLQTKALQTNSREVELGRSMHEWLTRMGLSIGGNTYTQVRDQAERISACSITFFWEDEQIRGRRQDPIVTSAIQVKPERELAQGELWSDVVELSQTFFESLKAHPVPIWEEALKCISSKSLAIDIYIWLSYRLRALQDPILIHWPALSKQFGTYKSVHHFKPQFLNALKLALAVYPEARVDVLDEGLRLHPSRAPIPERPVYALPQAKTG
jgi:hypothetical protein